MEEDEDLEEDILLCPICGEENDNKRSEPCMQCKAARAEYLGESDD